MGFGKDGMLLGITRSTKVTSAALAVILTEVDAGDNAYNRGTKTMVIPAHTAPSCRDVTAQVCDIITETITAG